MNMYLVDYIIGDRFKVVVVMAETQKDAMAKVAATEPDDATIRIQACQYVNDAVVLVSDKHCNL